MKIKSPKDFWSGLMFTAAGLFAMIWSLAQYRVGTALRMGPGYFPAVVGGLLAGLGLVILARSLVLAGGAPAAVRLRPMLLVVGAIVAYGYLMKPLGLVLATMLLVVVSALAGRSFRWREALALGAALVVFSTLVFVKGLSLPFPLCPAAIDDACVRALSTARAPPAAPKGARHARAV